MTEIKKDKENIDMDKLERLVCASGIIVVHKNQNVLGKIVDVLKKVNQRAF